MNNIKITQSAQGRHIGVAGDNYNILISGRETNGEYAVIDMTIPPGGGPLPHSHANIHEQFYVIEGELLFKTEAGHAVVTAGGAVDIPMGGAIHCFKNESNENARMLCTVSPAGLEEFFIEIGDPVQPGEFLPPPSLTPEFLEKLDALNKKYGQVSYAPDYLDSANN